MGCDSCKSMDKLDKLLSFLGVSLCYKCSGRGRVEVIICCCERETITCPECDGLEFTIEEDSILKPLLGSDDTLEELGLCD